ncbi:cytochrome c biogenesis heme-transporting ATPase CcmA [Marinospirillum insulare]|uniref:Cytochrome c biogenesis ATP-binding export protein CcmA n=1 Tax=Marinospirillum insulare TaxID=217169 RepID=A0ABQ5ZUN2_9GAMM|nr:cytochrome c biogenesis heme-transporting ATPase CcmA [Marinospirillum insulare]GLR63895.1 cytochrome c biogenesis ATP-binding export protein CcmA [Marinospirillum insulare]
MIKTPAKSTAALLTAHKLACERDERRLFNDLSFNLYAGELLQLEGPNGAGKTSLMRLLAGLLPFSEGEILWQGQNIDACREYFYQSILFIGHLAGIKAELSPLENLTWFAALEGIHDETLLEQALWQVGLAGYEDHPCHQLSAGQKRRAALARLTFTQRLVWLLDEPFTALDKNAVAAIENLLIAHSQAGGAVILTSHHALEALPNLKKLSLGEEL